MMTNCLELKHGSGLNLLSRIKQWG